MVYAGTAAPSAVACWETGGQQTVKIYFSLNRLYISVNTFSQKKPLGSVPLLSCGHQFSYYEGQNFGKKISKKGKLYHFIFLLYLEVLQKKKPFSECRYPDKKEGWDPGGHQARDYDHQGKYCYKKDVETSQINEDEVVNTKIFRVNFDTQLPSHMCPRISPLYQAILKRRRITSPPLADYFHRVHFLVKI